LSGLYSDLGVTFLRSGQKAAALEAFERVVELDPENPDALNNVAFLLADTGGDPAAALPHAERAAELRPNDWSIIDTLGWVHFLNGSLASAENRLRDSIALREQPANWLHLAHVLAEQDRLNEARQALERAAELQPDPRTRDEIERLADDIRTRTSRNQ
jgi:Flp pilus assembly protein TadD